MDSGSFDRQLLQLIEVLSKGSLNRADFCHQFFSFRSKLVDHHRAKDPAITLKSQDLVTRAFKHEIGEDQFQREYHSLWGEEVMLRDKMFGDFFTLCDALDENPMADEQFIEQIRAIQQQYNLQ